MIFNITLQRKQQQEIADIRDVLVFTANAQFIALRVAYGGCYRMTSGSQNLAVLPKGHDNCLFLRSQQK